MGSGSRRHILPQQGEALGQAIVRVEIFRIDLQSALVPADSLAEERIARRNALLLKGSFEQGFAQLVDDHKILPEIELAVAALDLRLEDAFEVGNRLIEVAL